MLSCWATLADPAPVSPPLFYGLTVASIGGPLALIALYGPQAVGSARPSAGLAALIASLFFVFPLAIWLRYSERIASAGGLTAFVEAAVGRRLALAQAGLWIVSYALYLIYTVPYIAYDLLPPAVPATGSLQPLPDVVLAVAIAGLMLAPLTVILGVVFVMALVQGLIALGVIIVSISHAGLPPSSFIGHGNLPLLASGAAAASLIYVCASLPLFLGGEVRGGGRTIRPALTFAFVGVAVGFVLAAAPLARLGNPPNSMLVGLGVAVSVAGLEIAEFLALSRLLAYLLRRRVTVVMRILVALFVAASLVALLNPKAVYAELLKPSLIALWLSQAIVVGAYPWFVRRHRKLAVGDVGLALAAAALMIYGLYAAVTAPTPT